MKKLIASLLCILSFYHSFSQEPAGQTVKGIITDEGSKVSIPGANILILNTNPALGSSSDSEGKFKIPNVPIGRQSIKISMMGYEEKILNDVLVTAGKEVVLTIQLTEAVTNLNEVEIVYDRTKDKKVANNDMAIVSTQAFSLEETKKFAGALGDPSRMAANFAGVVAGNDSRNDIVVRGNSPTGMLWQLEGLNIPNPNHFGALNSTGGPVSMINNNNLAKSDFMTSAFPAQYGNANAGVFDLRLRNGNTDKTEFLGQIGFNGFEGGIEGPIGKSHKASYLVNYRYSTLGVFQKIGIDFGTGSATPLYQDANYKLFIPIGSKAKVSVFGIWGKSNVSFLGKEADTSKTDLYGDQFTNTIVKYATNISGIAYDQVVGEKTSIRLVAGYTSTFESFHGDSLSVIDKQEFKSGDAEFKTEKISGTFTLNHKFNAKNTLVAGIINDYTTINLLNIDYDKGFIENKFVDIEESINLSQAFVQWKHRFGSKLAMVSGLHSQWLALNNSFSVEPRLAFRWTINSKNYFGWGYGLHTQQQPVYSYFVETKDSLGKINYSNKNLNFTSSHHIVLTYDRNIGDNTHIKTEAYYQYLFNVPVEQRASSFSMLNSGSDFAPTNNDSLVNKGTGQNYGLDLTLERYFNKGFYYLITASLFKSEYKGSDKVTRNTAFNTQRLLNVLGGKEFKIGKKGTVLLANIKVSWIGGRYLTPIDANQSALYGFAVYKTEEAYSEKQDDYFRCDIKLGYRQELKKATMEFSVDLQNVSNHKNVFDQTYNPIANKVVTNYQQGFFPVPTFRITF